MPRVISPASAPATRPGSLGPAGGHRNRRGWWWAPVFLLLLAAAIADIVFGSWAVLFTFDEILNSDAGVNFVLHGHYTSKFFGGFPFDPTISSGILTTWIDGVIFAAGGTLFQVRLVSRLL